MFVVLASVGLVAGCLSQSHVIPKGDLQVLAQQDPQTRGQRVRVIQGFATQSEPPPAPRVDGSGSVNVVVVTPVRTSRGPRVVSNKRPSAKSKADDARFWLIVAAAVAVGAAATEGARYDGWVQLHPMHPVHLYGWNGQYMWMPLAHITPETAAWTRKAVVRQSEGPWQPLGRAPLNRRGWSYSMLLGSSEVPSTASRNERGFTSHIQFGRFLTKGVGLHYDISMGWTEDEFGDTMYDMRNALELQVLPLSAGKIHAGGFGAVGFGHRLDDSLKDRDRQGFLVSGGAILQLELTTRLTITARAGISQVYDAITRDFTAGISVY